MRCAAAAILLTGCVSLSTPREPFAIPPAAAAQRLMQSRRFDTRDEAHLLRASSALLKEYGFTVDKSDEGLGVLVASKERSATETGQVIAAIIVGVFTGADMPIDDRQRMRASVVTRPVGQRSVVARVTFQRIVWNTHGQISKREQINEPEYYEEFFAKLAKALLLEAHGL
jgi:hypothetical protein